MIIRWPVLGNLFISNIIVSRGSLWTTFMMYFFLFCSSIFFVQKIVYTVNNLIPGHKHALLKAPIFHDCEKAKTATLI